MAFGKIKKTQLDKLYNQPQDKILQLSDGDNLYVIVTKIGSCIFKYRIVKHRVDRKSLKSWLTLGDYPTLSLQDAREKAIAVKRQILDGIDPVLARQEAKSKQVTVKDFAQVYFKERMPVTRKSGRSSERFIYGMNRYVINELGSYYMADITDLHIKKLIDAKVSKGQHNTAINVLSLLRLLFDYAIEKKLITSTPIANIKYYNIATRKSRKRNLSVDEIAQCLKLLYGSSTIQLQYKIAIHLLLMLLMRKLELAHATWDQVNFVEQTFIINTSKTDAELVIPLPTQAMKLFELLKMLSKDSRYIFVGATDINKPMHENTLNKQIEGINCMMFGNDNSKYFTIHDFRRTATTRLGEMDYPSDYIEIALNHRRAGIKEVYHRSQFISQRKEMLQHWADKLDSLIGEELLPYDKLLS